MEKDIDKNMIFKKLPLYFIYCFLGCILTIYISGLDINPITASSLVSIIIAFFTITIQDENHYSWAGFCGSFAGMTSFLFIGHSGNYYFLSLQFFIGSIILSVLTSILFSLSEFIMFKLPKFSFDGYGGRLGTIAFISVLGFIFYNNIVHKTNISFVDFRNKEFSLYYLLAIPSALIASFISMEIKNTVSSLNDNYKVVSVATTGLIGGILVTKIPIYGNFLGMAWYTGAFVGMSSYYILMLKRDFLIAGTISGILFTLTKDMFVGFGGKLGFVSFIAVLLMRVSYIIINKISKVLGKNPEDIINKLESGGNISNQNVNDDYAQKLVESLLQAKKVGENIAEVDEDIAGSYVLDEDNNSDEKNTENIIQNYDYLSPSLQELTTFFNYLGIKHFIYLIKIDEEFSAMAYQGVSEETISNTKFSKNSHFIKVLEKEKRIIGFSEKGINQKVFTLRIEEKDLAGTNLLIIFPIIDQSTLHGFFIVLDKFSEDTKNSLKLIGDYFESLK